MSSVNGVWTKYLNKSGQYDRMIQKPVSAVAIVACLAGCHASARNDSNGVTTRPGGSQAATSAEMELRKTIKQQQAIVEAYFGERMPGKVAVRVFASRGEMEAFAKQRWSMPELPCWAVAMGT